MEVESKPGAGSTFTVFLPKTEYKQVQQPVDTALQCKSGTETILVIDDEANILQATKEMLETLGYTVFTASSGPEGLSLLKQNSECIDMVILDMIMPRMKGSETYFEIKKIKPTQKILLSSGYNLHDEAKELLQDESDGFIQKPYNLPQLSVKLDQILRGEKTCAVS